MEFHTVMELMESHSITLSVTIGHPPNIQHSNRLFIEFDMFRILDTRCSPVRQTANELSVR